MRCGKNDDLEMLVSSLETFNGVRTNVNTCINYFSIRKLNLKNYIRVVSLRIIDTMDKSFVEIKDDSFLMRVMWRRKLHKSSIKVRNWRWSNGIDVLDRLQSLDQVCFMKLILILFFLNLIGSCLGMLFRIVLALLNWDSFDFLLLNQVDFCN